MSDVLTGPPQTRRAARGPSRLTSVQSRRMTSVIPYVLVIPVVAMIGLALGYPLVRQFIMSFQEYGLLQQFGAAPEWVGLDNYKALFVSSEMWAVVARSLVFCVVNAGLTMLLGMSIATLLTRVTTVVRVVLQSVLLVAWAMPVVASMTVFQWLFDQQYGVINWLLQAVGLSQFEDHSWFVEPLSFFMVATVIVVWMSVPFVVFSLYAALTQVSGEMLEAAQLDGANGWERFRHITLPSISSVVTVVALLQVIWDLRVFAQIFYLQEAGGSVEKTNLLGTYIYTLGIRQNDFGMASAVAIFMLLLTLVLTFGYVRKLAKEA